MLSRADLARRNFRSLQKRGEKLYSLVCMVVGLQCFIHTVSKLEFSSGLPVLELNMM